MEDGFICMPDTFKLQLLYYFINYVIIIWILKHIATVEEIKILTLKCYIEDCDPFHNKGALILNQ